MELYHHGIMGMHWGVRRYQNADGSLTSAGRMRYGYSEKIDESKMDKNRYSSDNRNNSKYSYSITGRKKRIGNNLQKMQDSKNDSIGATYEKYSDPYKQARDKYEEVKNSITDVPSKSIKKDSLGYKSTAFIDKQLNEGDKALILMGQYGIYDQTIPYYRKIRNKSINDFMKNENDIKKAEKLSMKYLNAHEKISKIYENMTDDIAYQTYYMDSAYRNSKDKDTRNLAKELRDFYQAVGQYHTLNNVQSTKESLDNIANDVMEKHNNKIDYSKYIGNLNSKTGFVVGYDDKRRAYIDRTYKYGKKSKADEIYYPSKDSVSDLRKIHKRGAYNTVAHSDDTLCHYGIMGMHWGVRRYQNADGTRTAAGKERYSSTLNNGNFFAERKALKYARERANNPIDPETGLHLKSREMSIKEDCDRVNPLYKSDTNDVAARHNCALCSVTYNLRRKGYDVTANLQNEGEFNEVISSWFKNPKVNSVKSDYKGADMWSLSDAKVVGREMLKSLKEQHGDNAYGIWTMSWLCGGGHAIAWEVKDGKPYFIDAQINKIYDEKNIEECFYVADPSSFTCIRADNADVNWKQSNVRAKVVGKNAKS